MALGAEWAVVKEIFFALGSIAGALAFLRPVIDSKFKRDQERADHVKKLLPEQDVIDLEFTVYQRRFIETNQFHPYTELRSDVANNADTVRFSGPLRRYYVAELTRLLDAYTDLREMIHAPQWKYRREDIDGEEETAWVFDSSAFYKNGVEVEDYAAHLDQAAICAERIRVAFQRFQVVSDVHLLESPFAWFLLKRRFALHGLKV